MLKILWLLLVFSIEPMFAEENPTITGGNNTSVLAQAKAAADANQWQLAEKLYLNAKNTAIQQTAHQQTLDILFSLLTVYQHLSEGVSAFNVASEIEKIVVNISSPLSLARSYRLLGIAYQSLANNALARDYYSVAVEFTRELNDSALLTRLLNELGYADVLIGDYQSAKSSFQESFHLARSQNLHELMLQAQINLTRVHIVLLEEKQVIQDLGLLEDLLSETSNSERLIENRFSIGTLYRTAQIKFELNEKYRKKAYLHYEQGLKLAKKNQNPHYQSIGKGYIGQVYSDEAQYNTAANLTRQAMALAQQQNNIDLEFRWTVQLARILSAQGNIKSGINQYLQAIDLLNQLDIVNFMRYERSFNTDVKPVYDELFNLYIAQLVKLKSKSEQKKLLNKILYYVENLRLKEISAFCFGNCNIQPQQNIDNIRKNTALLHIIVLKNQFLVIMKSESNTVYHLTKISREKVLFSLKTLLANIQEGDLSKRYLKQSKIFYQWIISPFREKLKKQKIDEISFLPPQALMKLPMSVLYDGKKFLIEKFSIKYIKSAQDINRINHWKFATPNYVLTRGNHLDSKANIYMKPKDDLTLKNGLKNIGSNQILSITNTVYLADDYRQSYLSMEEKNYPLFSLFSKINQGAPMGGLLFLNHKSNERNNTYFNGFILNARYIVSPLWQAKFNSRVSLTKALFTALKNGQSFEKSLQQAKTSLIHSKNQSHPIHWASLILLQH